MILGYILLITPYFDKKFQLNINIQQLLLSPHMQYLAAYTLASLSGKQPCEADITNILKATGKEFDAAKVTEALGNLKGKQVHELISSGLGKVGSVGGGAPAGKAPEAKKDNKADKKAEKKPEPAPVAAEQEEEDFNLDLFG